MSFDDLYRQNILDHYQNPRNFGTLPKPDISVEDSNPLCGDKIRMDLLVEDGRVTDVRFSGVGCSISRAAASMLTEEIKGKTLEEVKRIGREEVLEMLGIELQHAQPHVGRFAQQPIDQWRQKFDQAGVDHAKIEGTV